MQPSVWNPLHGMSLPECSMKIQMNLTVKSYEIRRGNHIDTTTKLREIIEKTLDFLPEKEKRAPSKRPVREPFRHFVLM